MTLYKIRVTAYLLVLGRAQSWYSNHSKDSESTSINWACEFTNDSQQYHGWMLRLASAFITASSIASSLPPCRMELAIINNGIREIDLDILLLQASFALILIKCWLFRNEQFQISNANYTNAFVSIAENFSYIFS